MRPTTGAGGSGAVDYMLLDCCKRKKLPLNRIQMNLK